MPSLAPSQRFLGLVAAAGAALVAWACALRAGAGEAPGAAGIAARFAPLLAIAGLGAYALASVAYRVLTFRTVPAEGAALRQDIKDAKAALGKLGIE